MRRPPSLDVFRQAPTRRPIDLDRPLPILRLDDEAAGQYAEEDWPSVGGSPEAHADGVPASPRGPILVPSFNELPRASKRRRTAVESVGDGATAAVDFRHSDFITCDVRLEGVEYDLDADDERFLLDTVNPRLAGARTASDAATRLSLDAFEVLVEELEREAFAAAQLRGALVHENHLMQHQLTLQDEVVSLLAAAAQLEGELAMPPSSLPPSLPPPLPRSPLTSASASSSAHQGFAPEWAGRDPSDDSANDAPKEKLSTTLPRARAVRLLAHLIVHHAEVVQPLDAAKAAKPEPQSTKAALLASAAARTVIEGVAADVYEYWLQKRESVGPLLRIFHSFPFVENWTRAEGIAPGHVSAEPHMSAVEAYEKLLRLRRGLDRARLIADTVRRREKLKKEWLRLTHAAWEQCTSAPSEQAGPRHICAALMHTFAPVPAELDGAGGRCSASASPRTQLETPQSAAGAEPAKPRTPADGPNQGARPLQRGPRSAKVALGLALSTGTADGGYHAPHDVAVTGAPTCAPS